MTSDVDIQYLHDSLRYEPETGLFYWRRRQGSAIAGQRAGSWDHGYVTIRIQRRLIKAHNIAWAMHYGRWPNGLLDHINRKRFDNRISNLRIASPSQNLMNKGPLRSSSSGVTGVYFHKASRLWTAHICRDYKRRHLGYFKCKDAAIQVRRDAEKRLFGEFAIPDSEYNAALDFAGSLNEGYAAIRDRVAAGGPGWERKE